MRLQLSQRSQFLEDGSCTGNAAGKRRQEEMKQNGWVGGVEAGSFIFDSPLRTTYRTIVRYTGTIPEELGQLTALEELSLSVNSLSGEQTENVVWEPRRCVALTHAYTGFIRV